MSFSWPIVFSLMLFVPALFLPAHAQAVPGPAPSPAQNVQPIQMRSVDMLLRYLNDLAARHRLPPPEPAIITREGLGQYFLAMSKKLSELPANEMTDQDYYDVGLLSEEFDDVFRVIKGRVAMTVLRGDKEAPPEAASLPQILAEFAGRFE